MGIQVRNYSQFKFSIKTKIILVYFFSKQSSVNIYDIEERTLATSNKLQLTSFRIILSNNGSKSDFKLVTIASCEIKKLERQLTMPGSSRINRQMYSRVLIYFADKPLIQFEFELGGHNEFLEQLNQQLIRKHWLYSGTSTDKTMSLGIAGIQKKIQDRLDFQDQKINDSFKVSCLI